MNARPKVLILNGPNLNLLGTREAAIYGSSTLDEINRDLSGLAKELGLSLEFFQSNGEGELVDRIQSAAGCQGIVINPAAYTHTSVAIRDALLAVGVPTVEIHLSNVAAREEFRQKSLISDVAVGTVAGFGAHGYRLALRGLARVIEAP